MMSTPNEFSGLYERLISSKGETVDLETARRWAAAADLQEAGRANDIWTERGEQISPTPSPDEIVKRHCGFLARCIREDAKLSDYTNTPSLAASEWQRSISGNYKIYQRTSDETYLRLVRYSLNEAEKLLSEPLKRRIHELFREAFLDHLLLDEAVRPLVQHWQQNPIVAQDYEKSMAWATDKRQSNLNK